MDKPENQIPKGLFKNDEYEVLQGMSRKDFKMMINARKQLGTTEEQLDRMIPRWREFY